MHSTWHARLRSSVPPASPFRTVIKQFAPHANPNSMSFAMGIPLPLRGPRKNNAYCSANTMLIILKPTTCSLYLINLFRFKSTIRKENAKILTQIFGSRFFCPIFAHANAKIAQLVEHNLAKVGVAGSSPVFRSPRMPGWWNGRHTGLKILRPLRLCGFKSRSGYHQSLLIERLRGFFI